MNTLINTGPLPAQRAVIVVGLLSEIMADNPLVAGFLLTGSIWNPASQLPESDVDINYVGQPAEGPAGDLLRAWHHMRDGLWIDLAPYIWGDITKPESLRLATVVSLARGHILWEKPGTISGPQATARRLLNNPDWVGQKVDNLIGALRELRLRWADPAVAGAPVRGDWDFIRHAGLAINGLLSPVDLRPPSEGRKSFMEIANCSREIGLPTVAEDTYCAVGMHDFADEEVLDWCGRIEQAYRCVAEARPQQRLLKRRYYTVGARSIVEKQMARAAVWPLWRAARECAHMMLEEAGPNADYCRRCFDELGRRLGVSTVAEVAAKALLLEPVILSLEQNHDRLVHHALTKAASMGWVETGRSQ